ncbi:MAG: hypothetical protein M3Y26_04470 [Actinomycetota bacterium]|nr:hypothetical protein [Actinomycetota bacterium]
MPGDATEHQERDAEGDFSRASTGPQQDAGEKETDQEGGHQEGSHQEGGVIEHVEQLKHLRARVGSRARHR